jgi:hypothetical protein
MTSDRLEMSLEHVRNARVSRLSKTQLAIGEVFLQAIPRRSSLASSHIAICSEVIPKQGSRLTFLHNLLTASACRIFFVQLAPLGSRLEASFPRVS